MSRIPLTVLVVLCLLAATAPAQDRPLLNRGGEGIHHGLPIGTAKAAGDTIYLIGNPDNPDHTSSSGIPPQHVGTFEDAAGQPDWNGWTHQDPTFDGTLYWQVSHFMAVNGSYSYWCGTEYDGDPGYGNDWNQSVVFTHHVADNAVASTVAWSATVQNDTEPDYDYTYLEVNRGGVWQVLNTGGYDGVGTFLFDQDVTLNPADYVGDDLDEIQLRIRFESDGAWSDEDGLYESNGACQVDDITVTVDGVVVDMEDFEDQVADRWIIDLFPGVGDFAQLFVNLQDLDPCVNNLTTQVAFIDDGVVVPGTGGSPGQTWRYGPGGFIVNNTGGMAGPDYYIHNRILSPILEWPDGADGCTIEFGVYRHEELGSYSVWPGMFYQWHVGSTNTGNPADLDSAVWTNRSFVQYGGPDYITQDEVVTDLLVPGRTHMRMDLRVIEYGYIWGWVGTDGTPAPYFDNVMVRAYPFAGPAMSGRAIDFFQDSFPASGDIDYLNLGNNSVRLDMARNIALQDEMANVPGDSMIIDVAAVRTGSVLAEPPRLHVRMKANELFDPYRTLPAGFTTTPGFFDDGSSLVEGWVYADSCFNNNHEPPYYVEDRWTLDLPDEGFFYPGDVLKWYLSAVDQVGGGDQGTTLMPADTSGFASFAYNHDLIYPTDFVVRALPSLVSATPGDQPQILFWNDFVGRGGDNEWRLALAHLGRRPGVQYDIYATNGPSSGVGNGLGGRATSAQLAGYDFLLYSSGDLSVNLLANGDYENDPSNDIAVVTNWFGQGDKRALFTGDNLVSGLQAAGATGMAFVNTFFSVNLVSPDISELIGNQVSPTVEALAGNGIISTVDRWIAYGGCPGINRFDGVECVGTAQRLAEFTDPAGNAGVYPYAAAVYHNEVTDNADVVLMPYDFMSIYNHPDYTPPPGDEGRSARALILDDIMGFWWLPSIGADTPAAGLTASAYPNPFNPQATVAFNLPRDGAVSVKVYNLRGEHVRTLVDGRLTAGSHDVVWDGKTDGGRAVSSGVYFYEVRTGGDAVVGKLTMVK